MGSSQLPHAGELLEDLPHLMSALGGLLAEAGGERIGAAVLEL